MEELKCQNADATFLSEKNRRNFKNIFFKLLFLFETLVYKADTENRFIYL